jgi:trafficking protein particle complex subunit 8
VNALHAVSGDLPAWAQLRALVYAVRWDIGIDPRELIGNVLEGDRWLVQAAGAVRTFLTQSLSKRQDVMPSKRYEES